MRGISDCVVLEVSVVFVHCSLSLVHCGCIIQGMSVSSRSDSDLDLRDRRSSFLVVDQRIETVSNIHRVLECEGHVDGVDDRYRAGRQRKIAVISKNRHHR